MIHVITGLGVGGAEHMLRRLVMAQHGTPDHRCMVISLTDIGPVGQMLQQAGIEVTALGLRSPLGLPRLLWRLRQLISDRQPDVVQTWMVHADLLGGLAARWAGVHAVIWGIRTTDFESAAPMTRVLRFICARLSRYLPLRIVCAAQASRRSHVAIGYDDTRMVVIPNGFDLQKFAPNPVAAWALKTVWGIGLEQVVIGHVARYNPDKDHLNFVRAATHVLDSLPECQIVLVGREVDDDNSELTNAIHASGHTSRFILLGERDDVAACLRAMDLFCLSSRTEGFPNVVGEAMACGVPCVVTNVGDAAMLVGNTGWVVPKENPAALGVALLAAAVESKNERLARGQLARQRIEKEFSMERATERFAQVQSQVAAQGMKNGNNKCVD